ncbi:hypothetical protein CWB96_06955 [Pseudoalteromonas citrea]|uniref:DUF805 domain-containing protein n=1 Tax=Pseudoalteromonas citrea TaxID=43655 RepID=A0A5S3XTH8_9GAMM|nr:hypothetical protein [Pseudoalteromonas citrea]TMP40895.1 hypothetical protein CWB97_16180 [Pseudoalteromonas citrea]TMP60442.1 hypothetical protein CWB96_06955 [Pseudoalteromonas citrea]
MLLLISFLLAVHFAVAQQCYRLSLNKGYPSKTFVALGLIPYFNLVVWVYLLFLPDLSNARKFEQPL